METAHGWKVPGFGLLICKSNTSQQFCTANHWSLFTFWVKWSSHAMRIRSAVAGELNSKISSSPWSRRAAVTASLMAKKTLEAKKSGGSPTAWIRNIHSFLVQWNVIECWHLRRVYCTNIGTSSQQRNVEFFRNVVSWWYFVVGRTASDDEAIGCKKRFFQSEQTEALNKTSLDLADVNGRIDTLAQIHDDIRPHNFVIARQTVDFNFWTGGPVGEISEGFAAVRSKVVANVRRPVKKFSLIQNFWHKIVKLGSTTCKIQLQTGWRVRNKPERSNPPKCLWGWPGGSVPGVPSTFDKRKVQPFRSDRIRRWPPWGSYWEPYRWTFRRWRFWNAECPEPDWPLGSF